MPCLTEISECIDLVGSVGFHNAFDIVETSLLHHGRSPYTSVWWKVLLVFRVCGCHGP